METLPTGLSKNSSFKDSQKNLFPLKIADELFE